MRAKISGIYIIRSKARPERCYIGSSTNINQRWKSHKYELRVGMHVNPKLQYHYNKYGESDLIFSFIIGCDSNNLLSMEQFYIDAMGPWFNISQIAGGPVSDNTRLGLSESKKGIPVRPPGASLTETHKRHISESMMGDKNPMFGKPSPKKGKKGNPNPFKGKKGRYSEETLAKMRISNQRAWDRRRQAKKEMEEQLCQG